MRFFPSLRCAHVIAALFGAAAAGCSSTGTQPADSYSVEGRYSVTVTGSVPTCSPAALPSPLGADTTKYAQLASQTATSAAFLRVQVNGTMLSLVPTSAAGDPSPFRTLNGAYTRGAPVFLSRAAGPLN